VQRSNMTFSPLPFDVGSGDGQKTGLMSGLIASFGGCEESNKYREGQKAAE